MRRFLERSAAALGGALAAAVLLGGTAAAQIIPIPIAPPKQAVVRNPNAIQIGTGDLNEAVNFAVQGNLTEAINSFNRFKQDFNAVADQVRAQSADVAD